jgi:hypothetical protein
VWSIAAGTSFAPAAVKEVCNLHRFRRENIMARGSKKKYTDKQKRQAAHIEEGYKESGTSEEEAERRAWATVNKSSGGGKKSGSGRGKKTKKVSAKKGGRKRGNKGGKKKKGGRKKKS